MSVRGSNFGVSDVGPKNFGVGLNFGASQKKRLGFECLTI